jgi:hypothetical protein
MASKFAKSANITFQKILQNNFNKNAKFDADSEYGQMFKKSFYRKVICIKE